MTAAAFTFTPDADFVDRALDAELRRDSESVDRKLRTMLAALDDSLAGISDAREELHTLYTAPGTDTAEDVAAHDQDIATHLAEARRNLRAAAEILRSHRQLTSPRPLPFMPTGDSKDNTISWTSFNRRWRFLTICGSNVPSRSRGTSIGT